MPIDVRKEEHLSVFFRHPEALKELDSYLRDRWTGDIRHFDPRVFDLLYDLQAKVGHPGSQIDIVCGYRSPSSNEFLRVHGHKVAQHSLHMQALAIDLRIRGVSTHDCAMLPCRCIAVV